MSKVNISNIDKDLLLETLWKRSFPASFFNMSGIPPPPFDLDSAKSSLDPNGYADYICGRIIKTNIYESDDVNPRLYDRDNGTGAFQEVVDSLRK